MKPFAPWILILSFPLASLTQADDRLPRGISFAPEVWDRPVRAPWNDSYSPIVRGQEEEEAEEEEGPIETDRPDFTEASSVVPVGVLQLESGTTFIYNDDNGAGVLTRSLGGPEMLLRYGVSEYFELRLVWNYIWERTKEGGIGTSADGAEDLIFGTKIALLLQDGVIPEAAMILHCLVPTGAEAFSNRNPEYAMNMLYGWDLPYDFTLAGSTGYSTLTEISDATFVGVPFELEDRYNRFHQSVTFGVPWTEELRSYFEYFGFYKDGLAGGAPEHYFDSGFTYLLNSDTQLDIRAGKGLTHASDDFFGGVGLSIRN